ncbi:MAG: hypothetical protein MMC23_008009 [Stictis urceolatum]|nr:hypothetical protein [Stictis urceolata]
MSKVLKDRKNPNGNFSFYRRERTFSHDILGSIMVATGRLQLLNIFQIAAKLTIEQHHDDVYKEMGDLLKFKVFEEWVGSEGNPALAEAWATEKISEWLSNVLKFETKDADTLVNIARGSNQDEPLNITNTGKRRSSILPLVKKHMTNTGFIMAFVNRIGKAEQEGELQAEVASNVFRDIFFNFASDFKVECQDEESIGSGGWGYTAKKNQYDTLLSTLAEGQSLGLLVDYALHFRSYDKVGEILHEMNSYPRGVTVLTMKKPIIPFLKSFSHTLVKHSILGSEEKDDRQKKALPLELFEKSLQGIPQDLLLKLYAPAPTASLNRFLRDPTKQVGRFPMGKGRRAHLHQGLNTCTKCRHTTERSGNPQTLVVTKTNDEYTKDDTEWRKRFDGDGGRARGILTRDIASIACRRRRETATKLPVDQGHAGGSCAAETIKGDAAKTVRERRGGGCAVQGAIWDPKAKHHDGI